MVLQGGLSLSMYRDMRPKIQIIWKHAHRAQADTVMEIVMDRSGYFYSLQNKILGSPMTLAKNGHHLSTIYDTTQLS